MTESEDHLSGMLREFESLLGEIENQSRRASPSRIEAIIAENRARVYNALDGMGGWLAEYFASHPPDDEAARIRQLFGDWLERQSQTVPTYASVRDQAVSKGPVHEALKHIPSLKPAGATLSAMVMSDFYAHCKISVAGRWVLETLSRILEREIRARADRSGKRVDVIGLQYIGGMEWQQVCEAPELLACLNLVCVEATTDGARRARRWFAEHLGPRVRVLRREPLAFLEAPQRDVDTFDIIYAATLVDWLDDAGTARLIRGAARALRPGGILVTANVTPAMPASEQFFRKVITARDGVYRGENDWRRLYWGTPFDFEATRFLYDPSGVTMIGIASRR